MSKTATAMVSNKTKKSAELAFWQRQKAEIKIRDQRRHHEHHSIAYQYAKIVFNILQLHIAFASS